MLSELLYISYHYRFSVIFLKFKKSITPYPWRSYKKH